MQYWSYEYFASSCPILTDPDDPMYPRMPRWAKKKRKANPRFGTRFDFHSAEQQLELRSPGAVRWDTFSPFRYKHDLFTRAHTLSQGRYMFLDPQSGGVYYLGERCTRQYDAGTWIPYDPPSPMSRIELVSYEYFMITVWPQSPFSSCARRATEEEWAIYYATVGRGAFMPPLQRGPNTDILGPASVRGPETTVPVAPTPAYDPYVYATQPSRASTSQPPRASTSQPPRASTSRRSIRTSFEDLAPPWTCDGYDEYGSRVTVPLAPPADLYEPPPPTSYSINAWRTAYGQYVNFSTAALQRMSGFEEEVISLRRELSHYRAIRGQVADADEGNWATAGNQWEDDGRGGGWGRDDISWSTSQFNLNDP